MKKNYILDTNILQRDPESIYGFEDNNVIVPLIVLEELDNHKSLQGEIGYTARESLRIIEKLRGIAKEQGTCLTKGVSLPNGGKFRIEIDKINTPLTESFEKKADNVILQVAKGIKDSNKRMKTIIVSNDAGLRVKADLLGIAAETYLNERVDEEYLAYDGRQIIEANDDQIKEFNIEDGMPIDDSVELLDNEFVKLQSSKDPDTCALGRYIKSSSAIAPLFFSKINPFGLVARNSAQLFAIEALMTSSKTLPFVILKGPAGTAKTLLTLACGLEQVVEFKEYRKVLVARANVEFDRDIGALPGTEQEKVSPLLRGVMDNLEILVDDKTVKNGGNEDELQDKITELFDRGYISIQALGFIRGRSISRQFILIDEAQNTTPKQMKGILTRAGEGTKIVICGDLDQIDAVHLDRHTNGLAYALEKFKGDPLCAILGFTEDESTRSPLAKRAAELMK